MIGLNSLSPARLSLVDGLVEEVVKEQVLEVGVGTVATTLVSKYYIVDSDYTDALVMSFRKTDRMMQPPRHMSAISGLLSFHLYSLAAF